MDDMDEYKKIYAEESAEHLNVMNDSLLALEKDAHNQETIHALFRAAHTLKGMSATMGYSSIAELTHQMENLMDMVKRNELDLDNESINLLFECVDALEEMVETPEDSIKHDISPLINKITALSTVRGISGDSTQKPVRDAAKKDTTTAAVPAAAIPQKDGLNTFNVAVTLDKSCALKSARLSVILRNLSECGRIIGASPPISDLTQEKFDRDFNLIVSTKEDLTKIGDSVKNIAEVSKVEVMPYTDAPGLATGAREGTDADKGAIKNIQTVRVNVERLDSMMDLVGELVINKIRLMQLASDYKIEALEEALSSLDRLTNQLQDEVMFSRMVPLEQIFNRFPRMMRDLAKKEHKDIDLVIAGGDIELDRAVLD
ncbi:MAG TPA: chemotaxis protein CheA, partial [Candidatus Methanoperedenaceae archaeon]|nr:chemotaxis protein CheA [Candidatus Methanoperedenaceae archaeon]